MLGEVNRRFTAAMTLVSGRNRAAVSYFPSYVMAAADLFSHADEGVAVLVGGSLPPPAAGRCLAAVANEFLPEGHARKV